MQHKVSLMVIHGTTTNDFLMFLPFDDSVRFGCENLDFSFNFYLCHCKNKLLLCTDVCVVPRTKALAESLRPLFPRTKLRIFRM